jgi:hypothetical protein
MFGFWHEFWAIPTANMTYTRSQNYTNMMVRKHETRPFKVALVVVAFAIFL